MKILLIEDDLDDIELLQYALTKHQVYYEMNIVNDGGAAVEYVQAAGSIPDIIIMDFNLPRVHGREVILAFKGSPVFENIPLVVLTTSSAREDQEYSYHHGADKYLIKPTDSREIKDTVEAILATVHLPKKAR